MMPFTRARKTFGTGLPLVGLLGRQVRDNVGTDFGTGGKFRPMFMRMRHAGHADENQHAGKLI